MVKLLTIDGKINNNGTTVKSNTVFVQHLGGGFFVDINGNLYFCKNDNTLIKIEIDESKGKFKKLLFVRGIGNLVMIALQIGSFYYQLSEKNDGKWQISNAPIVSVPDIASIIFIANDSHYYYGDLMTDRRVYYVDKNNNFCMTDVLKGTIQTITSVRVKHFNVQYDFVSIIFEDNTYFDFDDSEFSKKTIEEFPRKHTNVLSSNFNVMCSQIVIQNGKPHVILNDMHRLKKLDIDYPAELKCTNVIVVHDNMNNQIHTTYLIQTDNNEIIVCNDDTFEYYIVQGVCLINPLCSTHRQIKSARNI
jgi:hypothetical protein